MECLKAGATGEEFLLEYVLLWLFTSIELSMYMEKKALESSKPFVFFPCRFLSSAAAATTFLFNFRLLLKHFQFTSNENQE